VVTIIPAAPLDGAKVLPNVLVDQYVKPGNDQQALLDVFRLTALGWVEQHTARSLVRRRWVAIFDGFDADMRLPRDPVRSVFSLAYVDGAGAVIDGEGRWRIAGAQLLPAVGTTWPATADRASTVQVTFEAGYDDVASEAPALQVAALLLMKHLFDGGSIDDVPATVTLLLDTQYRTPVMA